MFKRMAFCLAVLTVLTVNAQNINLRGIISTQGGARVLPNAIVTLVNQSLGDTSLSTGAYSIVRSTAVRLPPFVRQTDNISLTKGILELNLTNPSPVKVEVFNVQGNLVKKEFKQDAAAGYRVNIADDSRAANLLVVKLSIGQRVTSFHYLPMSKGKYTVNLSGEYSVPISTGDGVAILAPPVDSLRATANGHTPKTIPVWKYDSIANIILDSLPGPSSGCGKLTSLASYQRGTLYSITSAGLSRRYIISIPANYDRNRPYRLVFAMHCMCGSMWSVNSENFYEYKKVADSMNVPCIFVAPSCYNGGNYNQSTWGCPVWDQGANDHRFFEIC